LKTRSVISAGGIVAFGIVAGRLLGLLREMAVAAYFGVSKQADAAIFLLIVPDFITVVFIGSSISATLVPAFAARSEERAKALLWQIMLLSVVGFLLMALLIFSQNLRFSGWFVSDENSVDNLRNSIFFTMFSLPFAGATAVFTAWLQYRQKFIAPASANAIFNITIIFTLLFASSGITELAIGIFIATFLRLFTHVFAFMRDGGKISFAYKFFSEKWEIDKKLGSIYLQTSLTGVFGMLPLYAPYFIITASFGGLALFNYAFKLVLLPAIVLQTVIQTVVLPIFVNQHKNDEPHIRAKTHSLSLHIGYIFSIAISLAVMLGAQPIAAVCFGRGKMTETDIIEIANLLRLGIFSTVFSILSSLWQQMLYAGQQAKSAMLASVLGAVLVFPLYWLGLDIAGAFGVMVGYLFLRVLHLVSIIFWGKRYIPLKYLLPNKEYIYSSSAMFLIFAISAFIYIEFLASANVSDILKVAVVMLIGGVMLAAGLFSSKQTREIIIPKFN